MEVKELKIGNWVSFISDDNFCQVSSIVDDLEVVCLISTNISSERGVDDYNPIPLTEEWLLKFGFYWDKKKVYLCLNEDLFRIRYSHNQVSLFQFGECIVVSPIKHVHQLQNLYFALTNKELKEE